jgi:Na+/melibiose symporter-like transporter
VILLGIVLVIFMAWRIWERFEDRVIDPFVDALAVRWAKMKDWAAGR